MTDDTTRQVREALKYATLIWSRYHDHGDPKDLKAAIGTFRRILASADVAATLPLEAQNARANLALALIEAFDYTNEIRYLDESIGFSTEALVHEPDGAGRLAILNTRYLARLKRFAALREPADLDAAAAAVEDMARFAPDAVATLMNRANLLMRRFDAIGSLDALDEAIVTFERCADVATEQRAVPLGGSPRRWSSAIASADASTTSIARSTSSSGHSTCCPPTRPHVATSFSRSATSGSSSTRLDRRRRSSTRRSTFTTPSANSGCPFLRSAAERRLRTCPALHAYARRARSRSRHHCARAGDRSR